jgi:hypothetical protein
MRETVLLLGLGSVWALVLAALLRVYATWIVGVRPGFGRALANTILGLPIFVFLAVPVGGIVSAFADNVPVPVWQVSGLVAVIASIAIVLRLQLRLPDGGLPGYGPAFGLTAALLGTGAVLLVPLFFLAVVVAGAGSSALR